MLVDSHLHFISSHEFLLWLSKLRIRVCILPVEAMEHAGTAMELPLHDNQICS